MGRPENNFDAIRLIAATAVIYDHSHVLTGVGGPSLLSDTLGGMAIKVFFVVSGYLIYRSWALDPNVPRYLLKRGLRIFPALLVLCIFTTLAVGPLLANREAAAYFAQRDTYSYFSNVLLLPQYFIGGLFESNAYPRAINGSLWSLPVEFAMYLFLPLAWWGGRLLRMRHFLVAVTLVACVASLWMVRIAPRSIHPIVYNTDLIAGLNVAPYFLLGALVAHMSWERFLDVTVGLVAVCIVAFLGPGSGALGEAVSYLLIPYVVLAFALRPHRLFKDAGRFGDLSYGIYIYGFLIQQCVVQLSGNSLSPMENTLATLPVVLVLAWLSWHWVEKPALARKPAPRSAAVLAATPAGP